MSDNVFKCLFWNSLFIERLCIIDSYHLHKFEVSYPPDLKYLELDHCHKLQLLNISAPNIIIIKLSLSDCLIDHINMYVQLQLSPTYLLASTTETYASSSTYPNVFRSYLANSPKSRIDLA